MMQKCSFTPLVLNSYICQLLQIAPSSVHFGLPTELATQIPPAGDEGTICPFGLEG